MSQTALSIAERDEALGVLMRAEADLHKLTAMLEAGERVVIGRFALVADLERLLVPVMGLTVRMVDILEGATQE